MSLYGRRLNICDKTARGTHGWSQTSLADEAEGSTNRAATAGTHSRFTYVLSSPRITQICAALSRATVAVVASSRQVLRQRQYRSADFDGTAHFWQR